MGDPLVGMIGALCVGLVLLVALVAVYSVRRDRRSRDRMRQWAERNGWTYTWRPDVDWGRRLPGGNTQGVGHAFSAIMAGRQVTVAEYAVTDASDGTTTNTHHHLVMAVTLNHALPPTDVEPRGPASRLTSKLLGTADAATGDPHFDHAFRVRTAEPAALHRWFSPALIAAHLAGRVPPSWSVHSTELLCHRPGRLQPDEIPAHASTVLPLADLLDRRHPG